MAGQAPRLQAISNGRGTAHLLELHLSKAAFASGNKLSGVVVFRLARPTSIRSITVSLSGRETPTGAGLTRALRRTASFFHREQLLYGMNRPRLTSERLSRLWNAFLGRDRGRILSPGEHTYPFSIALPASLPPSYSGAAGKVHYLVAARVQRAIGPGFQVSSEIPLISVPRVHKGRPVALSYPTAGGTVHASEINVSLELSERCFVAGDSVRGRFVLSNPNRSLIGQAAISLETCEWVRGGVVREIERRSVDSRIVDLPEPDALSAEVEFDLRIPENVSPTVEGTAISVLWLVKLYLNTSPPLELKTPITVCAPIQGV